MNRQTLISGLIIGALVGVVIGVTLELLISSVRGSGYVPGVPTFLAGYTNVNVAVAIERLVYAVIGAANYACGALFEAERLSLAAATFYHYLCIAVVVLGGALFLHWIPLGTPVIGFLAILTLIYLVIWLSIWLFIRQKIQRANARLGVRAG